MYSEILKNYIEQFTNKPEDSSLPEGKVTIHLPVHVTLINLILTDLISTNNGLKDFNALELSNLDNNEFTIRVDHKKINKTLRCNIRDVGYNDYSEALIIIDFIEGLRFYERIAIKSVLALQKGWHNFRSKVQESSNTEAGTESIIYFDSKGIVINISQALKNQKLQMLNKLIKMGDITTSDDQLIIDFELSF